MKIDIRNKVIIGILLSFICMPIYPQIGSVVSKIGRNVAEESIEKVAKKGAKKYGRHTVEQSVVNHALKKEVREQFMERLSKEGIESFFEYGNKKIITKISRTRSSLVKSRMDRSKYKELIKMKPQDVKNLSAVDKFKSEYLKSKLAKTQIRKELDEILAKGPILLSPKELKELLEHPEYLREYIRTKTGGKSGGLNNMQEFFIRLSMNNKEQVQLLLNNPQIRSKVNRAIRNGGGVHEWLMTKNFEDFLLNPKWGEDGPFLALALTKLVQRTEAVIFKYGGSHISKENSGRFHNGLAKVISECSTKEELFLAVKKYAKQNLSTESYAEFCQIFSEIFNTNQLLVNAIHEHIITSPYITA